MILILGGTTEGRMAVRIADEAGKPYYYSTRGEEQEITAHHGIRLTGAMDAPAMQAFCREKEIRLIVDAAHPFAVQLHRTIAEVASQSGIPVIRYERIYPRRDEDIIWCNDYDDAVKELKATGIRRLLALTGVQTIDKLKDFWQHRECYFRILDRDSSRQLALSTGFPANHLIYYRQGEDERLYMDLLQPEAILTKESGISGGFIEKVEAARQGKIKVFAIKRPALPDSFYTVNGEHGLRRAIEKYLPEFYPLRSGLTTGTCATAATIAAARCLFDLLTPVSGSVPVILPNGETIEVPIAEATALPVLEHDGFRHLREAEATVIKDAGDDPDVTNGLPVKVTLSVAFNTDETQSEKEQEILDDYRIVIRGGEGVGIITLPGFGFELGSPAINAGPRKMIEENLKHTLQQLGVSPFVNSYVVAISVPGGEEIATRTFNPRLGIAGGISIIGTSGIVKPFSSEAFVNSIRKSMEVARATGSARVVINSGAKSERYVRNLHPDLPAQAFVHYGNFIGETLKIAADLDIKKVTLGIMLGKAVKLAEGYLDTHSKKVTMNKEFLKEVARQADCSAASVRTIDGITLARELWTLLPANDLKRYTERLVALCHEHCAPLLPNGKLTIVLIPETASSQEK